MVERESKTQSKAINLLRKKGCYVYKNAQNMYNKKFIQHSVHNIAILLPSLYN